MVTTIIRVGEIIPISRGRTTKVICSQGPPQENKIDLEEALAQIVTSNTHFMNETKANMQSQSTHLQNQLAHIRNLETQLGQMAALLTERKQGSLLSTLEVNPRTKGKEQCKAIPGSPPVVVEEPIQKDQSEKEENEKEMSTMKKPKDALVV